jgi:hypothetical protein
MSRLTTVLTSVQNPICFFDNSCSKCAANVKSVCEDRELALLQLHFCSVVENRSVAER